ncbi:MAG: phosphotransferase [Spirochaetae bacterium HGW-Spirochaetae-7]|nr:MAG: phosphotransferase [Spirochaetae bacterium HGW-Spirochaetae-7]
MPPHEKGPMNAAEVIRLVGTRLPSSRITGDAWILGGGYLNLVWRVPAKPRSVIFKYAPPHLVSDPSISIDQRRLDIEARALEALGPGGDLSPVASQAIRAPALLDHDAARHFIIMEDIGEYPYLGQWLFRGADEVAARDAGRSIGAFIGGLHRMTYQVERFASSFDNAAIQGVRSGSLYRMVPAVLASWTIPDSTALGRNAIELGESLEKPGRCLTMGDLWPNSIIISVSGIRVIDWELAHFGRPLQDIGHLAAHLWMLGQRAPEAQAAVRVSACLEAFVTAYRESLGHDSSRIFGLEEARLAMVHAGCEILQRSVGNFTEQYLYAGLGRASPIVQEAVRMAVSLLRGERDLL